MAKCDVCGRLTRRKVDRHGDRYCFKCGGFHKKHKPLLFKPIKI